MFVSLKNKLKFMCDFYLIGEGLALYGDGVCQQELAYYFSNHNFSQRFLRLIDGLDQESIEVLVRIISRLQDKYTHKLRGITKITNKERDRLRYVQNEFFYQIICIGKEFLRCEIDNQGRDWYYAFGYYFPEKPAEIGVFLDHCGIANFHSLEKIKKGNIIDVGAFIGDSSVILSQYTDHHVYSFEASPTNFKKLQMTLRANLVNKIIPINKGLGDKNEILNLNYNNNASSLVWDNEALCSEKVEITTLDEYVYSNGIKVSCIKVDIEGYEMNFLKGAIQTLKTQKPALIISIYHSVDDFFEIKPFIESLDLGYSFKIFKPIDFSISNETCLMCEIL